MRDWGLQEQRLVLARERIEGIAPAVSEVLVCSATVETNFSLPMGMK